MTPQKNHHKTTKTAIEQRPPSARSKEHLPPAPVPMIPSARRRRVGSSPGPPRKVGACWRGVSTFFLGGGSLNQWVDLRENLQETIDFPIYSHGIWHLPVIFPLNQSMDSRDAISVANSWLVLGCLGRSTAIHQPGFLIRGWHYPLVNISKNPKKITISDGKTHYE